MAKQDKEQEELTRQMGDGYMLALNLVVSSLLGLGFGLFLDKWLGTTPLFLLTFLVLGFAAGLYKLIQAARKSMEEN
ncbi:MAG: AtpZ/AtpI family protein [Alphaproteobacteria bacterium]|nr:AtpZ/AtpI family protein [Alphaproteobacteria bacterium]MDD9919400.1 AtpZ/AtpI family protein [Alphaproteobacteria bacterium]